MKKLFYLMLCFLIGISFACEYDNYEPPTLSYSGNLTYKEQPFLYDGSPNRGVFKFVQSGFGKVDEGVGVRIDDKGHFTQLLFKGDYGLTLENNQYPFEFVDFTSLGSGLGYDTIQVHMDKNVQRDFEVIPYYEITDLEAAPSGLEILAKFKVKKVSGINNPVPPVVKARLYLSTSNIVNSATTCVGEASVNITEEGEIQVPVSVISYRSAYKNNFRNYAYYRVALELQDIKDYYLFSEVKKVEEIPLEFNDVTEQYMTNYKQAFEIEEWLNDRRGKVKGWTADPGVEGSMFDGWGDRLFMSAENWCGGGSVTGGVWQTTTLPAGKYIFLAKRGWNNGDLNGGTDRAYLAVAEGNTLHWDNAAFIGKADLSAPQNKEALSIDFELAEATEISLGYVVNLVPNECNAVSFTSFSIIQIE